MDLTLDPNQDTFSGVATIEIDLRQPTSLLWLNGRNLTIQSSTLQAGGKRYVAETQTSGKDFIGFSFTEQVTKGSAVLTVAYQGKFNKNASAELFKMKDGENWYLYTQFEPLDARAAFPCFDEPSYKVPWQLTLHVPQQQVALSNTPITSETPEPEGRKKVVFAPTKPLPSYLVAMAVGPFEFVDGGKAGRKQTPVRIVVPKGKASRAKYAAEVTGTILARLEDYFGIPYPYEKLDSLAIPLTYGFGAMENAGLVTYEANLILADPAQDTIRRQRYYAVVCAHELAHQWFGNLVTMEWWNDTWLNEGFATWMESKLIAEWKPEWNTRLNDVSSQLGAMRQDSLMTARRVRQPIQNAGDVANAFDGITYQKGAAIIRMFEAWVGENNFRQGVQQYLKQYAFRNASAGDFLDAIGSKAGKQNVTRAFSTFLEQAGVPLVSVDVSCPANEQPGIQVTQQRSLPVGSSGQSKQTWQLPLCVRYAANGKEEKECFLLLEQQDTLQLNAAKQCPTWLVANVEGQGYYRVRYSTQALRNLLIEGGQRLTPAETIKLLGDMQALMESGAVPAQQALTIAKTFANSPQRQVVQRTMQLISSLETMQVAEGELLPRYAKLVNALYGERARTLGWSAKAGEEAETRLLRSSVVPFVATAGEDQTLVAEAQRLAGQWLESKQGVDTDMLSSVLSTAARFGGKPLFERMLATLRATQDRQQRSYLFTALGSFRDPALVQTGMALLLTDEFDIREAGPLLFGPAAHSETRTLPFAFVQANFDALVRRSPTGTSFDFGARLPQVAGSFCDTAALSEVERFFTERVQRFTGGPRVLSQTLESSRLCAALRDSQQASARAFLQAN